MRQKSSKIIRKSARGSPARTQLVTARGCPNAPIGMNTDQFGIQQSVPPFSTLQALFAPPELSLAEFQRKPV